MDNKVICFGEMLWDCFPDQSLPGGAPMNVALHLSQLGVSVKLLSSVGNDEEGNKLLDYLKGYTVADSLIQMHHTYPSGKVLINDADKENISYQIIFPSAWDFIQMSDEIHSEVLKSDVLVFGSLATRNEQSWNTLNEILKFKILKIFDLNLRPPFIDFSKIQKLLGFTDVLKINDEEMKVLAGFFQLKTSGNLANTFCSFLNDEFNIETICITLGSQGALLYSQGKLYKHQGYKVKVEDTVGSGDAFLSAFIAMYLKKEQPAKILDFSCKLGAFVASKKGGTPKYKLQDIHSIE